MTELENMKLAKINSHERDKNISFQEEGHIYTIHTCPNITFMSVTTWNHTHFKNFDADKIIKEMMSKKTWTDSQYYGLTPEQIKDRWNENRDNAATAGTKLHYDIESYYNDNPKINNTIEYQYFMKFVQNNPELVPFRTEWLVWDQDLQFAGAIDMVFIKPDGSLMIYDWKRCKCIRKTNFKGECASTKCIEHIPDTNFWHYSLQLNTYKALIEKNYGYKVSDMRLVCFHPDNKDYQVFAVPDLSTEIADLFELRRSML